MGLRLVQPVSESDWRTARDLVEEYVASLGLDLSFQDIEGELGRLPQEYGPPGGAFLLAQLDGHWAGCVGVRPFRERTGEVKRLYARPETRGRGVGRALASGIVDAARRIGYARLLLDTLPWMTEAVALYESLGFRPVEAYCHNPVAGAMFFERVLDETGA